MANELKSNVDKMISRFAKAGINVQKVESSNDLKTKSWIMPTNDRKGMVKIVAKNK